MKAILDLYLDSNNKFEFYKHLKDSLNLPEEKSKAFYYELTEFLKSANSFSTTSHLDTSSIRLIKNTDFSETYCFGNSIITVYYDSLAIKNLIHPLFAHTNVAQDHLTSALFAIFKKDDALYLFKNGNYIGHYAKTDYHLLQGQFALQLINTLYDKNESDWIATFHASTVTNGNEAIMIIGDSGNGKSTLSAVLMAHGYDVLADDFTPLLAEDRKLYRFPSGISVKKGAFNVLRPFFVDFDQFPLYASTSKKVNIKYIPPIKSFGQGISHVPCQKIVYVKYDPTVASTLQQVNTEKILETLIPESWLSPLASNAELFLEWIKELKCFELNYSDNTIAVSQFKRLFHS
ncbi:hypothetical protein [Gelidibacter mesophilus]|uniref:hypothetical protein n=1 Tax=Gelidibacter mesophilus TaxID=169050 RepID=UPI000489B7AA|nr:hypothetical protein [Gelidibacter mesophilus]